MRLAHDAIARHNAAPTMLYVSLDQVCTTALAGAMIGAACASSCTQLLCLFGWHADASAGSYESVHQQLTDSRVKGKCHFTDLGAAVWALSPIPEWLPALPPWQRKHPERDMAAPWGGHGLERSDTSLWEPVAGE